MPLEFLDPYRQRYQQLERQFVLRNRASKWFLFFVLIAITTTRVGFRNSDVVPHFEAAAGSTPTLVVVNYLP
jgi:hypothetical protein